MSTSKAVLLAIVLALPGCRNPDYARADERIVYDQDGCAYFVRRGVGDVSFVAPLRDANKPECKQ